MKMKYKTLELFNNWWVVFWFVIDVSRLLVGATEVLSRFDQRTTGREPPADEELDVAADGQLFDGLVGE